MLKDLAVGAVQSLPTQGGGCTWRYDVEVLPESGVDFSAAVLLVSEFAEVEANQLEADPADK